MRSLMIGLAPVPWVLDALKAQRSIAVEYIRFPWYGRMRCQMGQATEIRFDHIVGR